MYHIVGQLLAVAQPHRNFSRELAVAAGRGNSSGVVQLGGRRVGTAVVALARAAFASAAVDPGFQEFISGPFPELARGGELMLNHRGTEIQRRREYCLVESRETNGIGLNADC